MWVWLMFEMTDDEVIYIASQKYKKKCHGLISFSVPVLVVK